MDNWQANPAPYKVTWIGAYLLVPDCALQKVVLKSVENHKKSSLKV